MIRKEPLNNQELQKEKEEQFCTKNKNKYEWFTIENPPQTPLTRNF